MELICLSLELSVGCLKPTSLPDPIYTCIKFLSSYSWGLADMLPISQDPAYCLRTLGELLTVQGKGFVWLYWHMDILQSRLSQGQRHQFHLQMPKDLWSCRWSLFLSEKRTQPLKIPSSCQFTTDSGRLHIFKQLNPAKAHQNTEWVIWAGSDPVSIHFRTFSENQPSNGKAVLREQDGLYESLHTRSAEDTYFTVLFL